MLKKKLQLSKQSKFLVVLRIHLQVVHAHGIKTLNGNLVNRIHQGSSSSSVLFTTRGLLSNLEIIRRVLTVPSNQGVLIPILLINSRLPGATPATNTPRTKRRRIDSQVKFGRGYNGAVRTTAFFRQLFRASILDNPQY